MSISLAIPPSIANGKSPFPSTVLARAPTNPKALEGHRFTHWLLGQQAQKDGRYLSAVRHYRKAEAPEELAAADQLFEHMLKLERKAEDHFQQNDLVTALDLYRNIEAKLEIIQKFFPKIHLGEDSLKAKHRIVILESRRNSLRAKGLLAEVDAEFEPLQTELIGALSANLSLEAVKEYQRKLALLKTRYLSIFELDSTRPSKYDELIQLRQSLKKKVEHLQIIEMGRTEWRLKHLSLHNADNLAEIQELCAHWIDLFARLPIDRKPLHRNTLYAIQEISTQAFTASHLLSALQTGPFLIGIIQNLIGKQNCFSPESHPLLLQRCKPLFDSPSICNQWICLTPQGICSLKEKIAGHFKPFIKSNWFLAATFSLNPSCPALCPEQVEAWMKEALQHGEVRDLREGVQVFCNADTL